MYEITRWFEIDAGHRVPNHESKCRNLHGHRYRIGFVLQDEELDKVGRVRDFGTLKEEFGTWLDTFWDHGMILSTEDRALGDEMQTQIPDQKVYYLPCAPTAENMAWYLYDRFKQMNFVQLKKVIVYETPNCCARYPTLS